MSHLEEQAESLGLLTRYTGADGRTETASVEALTATLDAITHAGADDETEPPPLPPVLTVWDGAATRLPTLEPALEAVLELESGERRTLRIAGDGIEIPEVESGYHRADVAFASGLASATVIAAPTRAYRPAARERTFGLFAPVYALDDGTYADLGRLCDRVAEKGGSFVGTLPLLPTFDHEPSPYSPVSRLFWNEKFVTEAATVAEVASDDTTETRPLLEAYARFRARHDGDGSRARYYRNAQLAAERELETLAARARSRGVGLYLDLPLGAHRDGFDIASSPELFAARMAVGAPPDALYEGGQNWSFPPVLPRASRSTGHAYFRRVVRHHMRHAALLRVDHVMGLHRQYWIPEGLSAREGVYVRYPAEELYAILALESHRTRTVLVGENLGTVPPEVDESLARHGLLSLFVLEFSLGGNGPRPGPDTMASIDTHDTPTFAGFCRNASAETADAIRSFDERLGMLPSAPEPARLEAWLRWLLESDAPYVTIALEDLWLEEDPQNVPGTTTEHTNWKRKLRYGLDDWPRDVEALLDRLSRTRPGSAARKESPA